MEKGVTLKDQSYLSVLGVFNLIPYNLDPSLFPVPDTNYEVRSGD